MESIFNKIIITKAEYSIIKTLHTLDQVRWLFDAFDSSTNQTGSMDLSAFFKDVKNELDQYNNSISLHDSELKQNALSPNDDIDFVDVMIDDKNIMIESNSLKALRHVKDKFIESGYMLQRDLATEKMFRKDKTTRYIRIFRIINYTNSMCFN